MLNITDLYNEYRDDVYAEVFKLTNNPIISDEITNDVFIKIVGLERNEKTAFCSSKSPLINWLLMIIRGVVSDYYKSAQYQKDIFYSDNLENCDGYTTIESDNNINAVETLNVIDKSFNTLRPTHKKVAILHFKMGRKLIDISTELNIHISCVKRYVVESRKLLTPQLTCCF